MPEYVQGASPILLLEWWKPVPNWDGWYEVSNLGTLRRVRVGNHTRPGKVLVNCKAKNGYIRNVLVRGHDKNREMISRHRVVATAFLGKPEPGWQVNHKNAIKHDNRLSNLEWVTPSQNIHHALKSRLIKCGLTDEQVRQIRKMVSGRNMQVIANHFGIDRSVVSRIMSGHQYHWVD